MIKSRAEGWILFLALLAHWWMAVSVSPRLGVTADEAVHLVGGYSYWHANDYRLHPENGNLAQRLAALPLLGLDLNFLPPDDPDWKQSLAHRAGDKFLFQLGNPVDRMLQFGRMAIALAGTFVVWLTWRWSFGLFGREAGWLALGLAVFSPTLLAHGALATSDMVLTACMLAALSSLWLLLHRVTLGRIMLAGCLCGLTFLAKMSGVIVAPLAAGLLLVRLCRPASLPVAVGRLRIWARGRPQVFAAGFISLATVGAISLLVLWAGYGFRFSAFNPRHSPSEQFYFTWDAILEKSGFPFPAQSELQALNGPRRPQRPTSITRLVGTLRDHRLLPEAYLWGFAHTYRFSRERQAFLRGEHSSTGWRTFFPWTFWLKTTPALLLLFAGGTAIAFASCRVLTRWWYRAIPLTFFFAVYWAMAIDMTLNIGHRHILPIYPIVIIFASAAALALRSGARRLVGAALGLALLVHGVESARARPFYLSYFQPAAGGTERGYEHLVDSSFDWGQGLPALRDWLEARRAADDARPVFLSYFGADNPQARGLNVIRFGDEIGDLSLRSFPTYIHGGWFVISATFYQGVYSSVRGAWRPEFEALYLKLHESLAKASATGVPADPAARKELLIEARDYEALQFARLCHYLHQREPDALIGASLLVFELSDGEVKEALYGSPPIRK